MLNSPSKQNKDLLHVRLCLQTPGLDIAYSYIRNLYSSSLFLMILMLNVLCHASLKQLAQQNNNYPNFLRGGTYTRKFLSNVCEFSNFVLTCSILKHEY